jgi:hypothetical protein
MFDTICAALETWLPANRYVVRHAVNATFGWVGVLYCGRLAGRLFGPWAGVLALVLLAASPRYFADSMNNPKDLPFAAMTVMALYYISGVSARWPYVSRSTALKIALSLALALGIRVGALLYLGYFVALIGLAAVVDPERNWRRLAGTASLVLVVTLATLLLGTLFWPWAGGAPLTRPFQALLGAANYPWDGTVLFRGEEYLATKLPWYYAPWWLLISTPPVVLGGAALSVFSVSSREDAFRRVALWGMFVFPVAGSIVMGSTLYDGIRHLSFIYTILVVLAASGWTGMLIASRPQWLRRAAASCLAVAASMLVFDIRFHPNQGVSMRWSAGHAGPSRHEMDTGATACSRRWNGRGYGPVVRDRGLDFGSSSHLVQLNAERFHRCISPTRLETGTICVQLGAVRSPPSGSWRGSRRSTGCARLTVRCSAR